MKFFRMDSDLPGWDVWHDVYRDVGRHKVHFAMAVYQFFYASLAAQYDGSSEVIEINLQRLADDLYSTRQRVLDVLLRLGLHFDFALEVGSGHASADICRTDVIQMSDKRPRMSGQSADVCPTFVRAFYPKFLEKQVVKSRDGSGRYTTRSPCGAPYGAPDIRVKREEDTCSNVLVSYSGVTHQSPPLERPPTNVVPLRPIAASEVQPLRTAPATASAGREIGNLATAEDLAEIPPAEAEPEVVLKVAYAEPAPKRPMRHAQVDVAAAVHLVCRLPRDLAADRREPVDTDDWANQLRLLREQTGVEDRVVGLVIRWIFEEQTPWAKTIGGPRSLRRSWDKIFQACIKWQRWNPEAWRERFVRTPG